MPPKKRAKKAAKKKTPSRQIKNKSQNTKEAVKKTGKATDKVPCIQRRFIRIGIIISAVVLIISLLLFLFGTSVTVVLKDELNIRLEPSTIYRSAVNSETVQFTIRMQNDNIKRCTAVCNTSLVSLKDGSIHSLETRYLEHNEIQDITYSVTLPGKGEGQQLYQFEVNCRNQKAILCRAPGNVKTRSALITIDFKLSDEEKEAKELVETSFPVFQKQLAKAQEGLIKAKLLSEHTPQNTREAVELSNAINSIDTDLKPFTQSEEQIRHLWSEEQYIEAKDALHTVRFETVETNINETVSINEKALRLVELRNANIMRLKAIADRKDALEKAEQYLVNEPTVNHHMHLDELKQRLDSAVKASTSMGKEGVSEQELFEELTLIESSLDETIIKIKQIKAEGRFIYSQAQAMIDLKQQTLPVILLSQPSCKDLSHVTHEIALMNNLSRNLKAAYVTAHNLSAASINSLDQELMQTSEDIESNANTLISDTAMNMSDLNVAASVPATPSPNVTNYFHNESTRHLLVELPLDQLKTYSTIHCTGTVSVVDNTTVLSSLLAKITIPAIINATIPPVEVLHEELKPNPAKCCYHDQCEPCCYDGDCGRTIPTPVLFIHGHSFSEGNSPEISLSAFSTVQNALEKQGYINAGRLDLSETINDESSGVWGRTSHPISVSASYYYITYYSLATHDVAVQKSERIENYALRLREIIGVVLHRTGAKKVNIVAHSMGGLVTREYVSLFGTDTVNKMILVGTPNHGITGKIKRVCSLIGASRECQDMSEGSVFLQRLNSKPVPEDLTVIRAIGCEMGDTTGDGVVTGNSAYLEGANNILIESACPESVTSSLHNNLLNANLHPEVTEEIVRILSEK